MPVSDHRPLAALLSTLSPSSVGLKVSLRTHLRVDDGFLNGLPPADACPLDQYAWAVVDRLAGFGMIDASLFARLVAARPRQRDEILRVAGELAAEAEALAAGSAAPSVGAPVGNIPPRADPFVGRGVYLERIAASFAARDTDAVVVLSGPPGVGKSEIACEFARRPPTDYQGAFFVPFGREGLPLRLAEIGRELLGLELDALSFTEQCDAVVWALAAGRYLLVYDDVDSPETLRRWSMPAGSRCQVIATSLGSSWPGGWVELPVAPLSDDEARAHIEALTADASAAIRGQVRRDFAAGLIERAGGLPAQLRPETKALCKHLANHPNEPYRPRLTSAADRSISQVWELLSEPARQLLGAVALFRSEIARDDLGELLVEYAGFSDELLYAALDECLEVRLLTCDRTSVGLRGPLAEFVRARRSVPEGVHAAVARRFVAAARAIVAAPHELKRAVELQRFPLAPLAWTRPLPPVAGEPGSLIVSEAMTAIGDLERALEWAEVAVGAADGPVALGKALGQRGECQRNVGRFAAAVDSFERALACGRATDDAGRHRLGHVRQSLGVCLRRLHRMTEARDVLEQAVSEFALLSHSSLHCSVGLAASLSDLGRCHSDLGDLKQSIALLERASEVLEGGKTRGHVHGVPDREGLSKVLTELGNCYDSAGRTEEAIAVHERAIREIAVRGRRARNDHARLGRALTGLGHAYYSSGRLDQALDTLRRAEEELRRGDRYSRVDSDRLGHCLYYQGLCLSNADRNAEALDVLRDARRALERGDLHGQVDDWFVAKCLAAEGGCLIALRRPGEARELLARAVERHEAALRERRLHANHGEFADALFHHATCLYRLTRYGEAKRLFARAIEEAALGDSFGRVNHQRIGRCHAYVGYCWYRLERHDPAVRELNRAIEGELKGDVRGRVSHEHIGTHLFYLGRALAARNSRKAAVDAFERAVAAMRTDPATLDHREVAACLREAGRCHVEDRAYEPAIERLECAIEEGAKGNTRGEVNHETLGDCWHLLGRAYLGVERVEEALSAFTRANAARRSGLSVYQAGRCHARLGDLAAAVTAYQSAFVALTAEKSAEARACGRDLLDGLRALGRDAEAGAWQERIRRATPARPPARLRPPGRKRR